MIVKMIIILNTIACCGWFAVALTDGLAVMRAAEG
jgi:hypothetical protein